MVKIVLLICSICMLTICLSCSKDSNGISDEDEFHDNSKESTTILDSIENYEDNIINSYKSVLDNAKDKYDYDILNDYILIVNTTEQLMYLIKNSTVVDQYIISTGKTGEGNIEGSGQTPLGYHQIIEKIGDNAPIGTIFISKINTGRVSKIYTDDTDLEKDPVTTRILSLDGLEEGYNKGGNVDSFRRYIYIHGTPEEGLLGEKHSHGCIRMNNNDVIDLFNTIENNIIVYITQ